MILNGALIDTGAFKGRNLTRIDESQSWEPQTPSPKGPPLIIDVASFFDKIDLWYVPRKYNELAQR